MLILSVICIGFALWWGIGWACLIYMGLKEDYKHYWRIKNGDIRRRSKTARRVSTQS